MITSAIRDICLSSVINLANVFAYVRTYVVLNDPRWWPSHRLTKRLTYIRNGSAWIAGREGRLPGWRHSESSLYFVSLSPLFPTVDNQPNFRPSARERIGQGSQQGSRVKTAAPERDRYVLTIVWLLPSRFRRWQTDWANRRYRKRIITGLKSKGHLFFSPCFPLALGHCHGHFQLEVSTAVSSRPAGLFVWFYWSAGHFGSNHPPRFTLSRDVPAVRLASIRIRIRLTVANLITYNRAPSSSLSLCVFASFPRFSRVFPRYFLLSFNLLAVPFAGEQSRVR